MQIVITDGHTLNPGDLSWAPFEEVGAVTYYDRTSEKEAAGRCRDADVLIVNKTLISRKVIEAARNLQLIAVTATGYNCIDITAAREKGITVCNVPVYGTYSVAQHTIALLLELTNHCGGYNESIGNGEWSRCPDWSYTRWPIIELWNKTMGIVGYGRIGRQTALIARALGMRVLYFSKSEVAEHGGVGSLAELFEKSDFVSLHCPLTAENKAFVDRRLIDKMKPGAYLINTSRGQLINEEDLASALRENRIAGAALDVLSQEPPSRSNPLLGLRNCLITPHNAWQSFEARQRLTAATYENVKAFLSGKPVNVVN